MDRLYNVHLVSAFLVVPNSTCVPCGGQVDFYCSTTTNVSIPDGNGGFRREVGAGGQLWKIKKPDGTVDEIRSNHRASVNSTCYEFLYSDEYIGLRVLCTSSSWNGTTLQCIAFTPANESQQNPAPAVLLEVGGVCRICVKLTF